MAMVGHLTGLSVFLVMDELVKIEVLHCPKNYTQ